MTVIKPTNSQPTIHPARNLGAVSNANPLNTWSNEALFKEVERLTLLTDNLAATIKRLAHSDDAPVDLILNLRNYCQLQIFNKMKVQKYIINTRKG